MKKANEKISAAIVIIGNEILSGRTQDVNVSFLSKWLNEEKLKMPTHLVEGDIDKFPEIFEDLYKGKNYGKFVLKLKD